MEQRRFIFWIVAFVIGMAYWHLVVPRMHPEWFKPPVPVQQADTEIKPDEQVPAENVKEEPGKEAAPKDNPAPAKLDLHPRTEVVLGSLDPKSGFYIQVFLTSEGASISSVKMNDPRYKMLENNKVPLQVLGNNPAEGSALRTLSTSIPQLDVQLLNHKTSSTRIDWAVDANSVRDDHALFYIESPDKSLRVEKEFSLVKAKTNNRDYEAEPYVINFEMRIINKGQALRSLRYELQGPVGVPIEDPDNARRYLELQVGFQSASNQVEYKMVSAQEIVTQFEKAQRKLDPSQIFSTKRPVKYIGIDERYFVALLNPVEDQIKHNYFSMITADLLRNDDKNPPRSPISFKADSEIVDVAPGNQLAHNYKLYVGPKRDELMAPFQAGDLMQFGWFGWFSRLMLWIMSTLHDSAGLPYWLAIIILTVIVRGAMYPMSRRQALSMKHIKDMQPAMNELQAKYKDDKEKLAMAQLQLMKEHGVSPLMGCMPFFLIMLQMPIFIGLYNALANAIELRLAPFLYIQDLASPDKLFTLPFSIPFLGTPDVNLLPMLTIVLFLVQQKMYMPPATTDEQKVQQQMMTFMMIFMGFMFYKVPSGLCVYFIASSLWGLVERRILEWHDDAIEKRKANKAANKSNENSKVVIDTKDYKQKEETSSKPSWAKDLWEKIDKAANPQDYKGKNLTKKD